MKAFAFTDVLEPAGDKPIRVLARISVLKTEDGGRRGPFTVSYRPNHNFGGPNDRVFYVGQVEVPEGTWVHPGETRELVFTFINCPWSFRVIAGRSHLAHSRGGDACCNRRGARITRGGPNNSMQRTALRAAADAERWTGTRLPWSM